MMCFLAMKQRLYDFFLASSSRIESSLLSFWRRGEHDQMVDVGVRGGYFVRKGTGTKLTLPPQCSANFRQK